MTGTYSKYEKVLFLLMLFLISYCISYAQPKKDTLMISDKEEYPVWKYLSYYSDTVQLTISTIKKKEDSGFFRPMNSVVMNQSFTDKYYWFALHLNNISKSDRHLMWVFVNNTINHIETYSLSGQTFTSLGVTGDHYPFARRPYYFILFTYPLQLDSAESKSYYTFIDKKGENLKLSFYLMTASRFGKYESNVYFSIGIMCGILLLVFLFNIFLYYSLKDSLHGWYAIYVLITFLQVLAYEGMDFQFLYPNYPPLADIAKYITSGLNLFLMIHIMQKFLSQTQSNSRYFLVAETVKWIAGMMTIACVPIYKIFSSMLVKEVYAGFFSIITVFTIGIIIVSAIEKIRQGFKPAYFYLIALAPLFAGGIEFILNLFGIITTFLGTPNRVQMGVVAETVIISFGILYRYNLFKKDKEQLAIELDNQRLVTASQIIQSQETERKRIAEDLHDELGGDLAAIKMKIQYHLQNHTVQSELVEMLDKASADVRNISHNLMPPEFSRTKLDELLLNYFQKINTEKNILFRFYTSGDTNLFDKQNELMLYRIIMELTNNIIKHSEATEAAVQMIYQATCLEIMIEDNGIGLQSGTSEKGGIGLKNVISRVNYLHGEITIDSGKKGTTIIIQIPYQK